MENNIFLVAMQSSLVLGLVHGINPCGHSWLVLAPFVAGDANGRRVFALTASFAAGTATACLGLGLTLGALSGWLAPVFGHWADLAVNAMLIGLGLVLMARPGMLHGHEHTGDHDHDHDHHGHGGHESANRLGMAGLFGVGFVNMIVPCPTLAIMYTYALTSANAARATAVFAAYAAGTAVTLGLVIFAIFKVTGLMRRLQKPWVEGAVLRTAGLLTAGFGLYGFFFGQ